MERTRTKRVQTPIPTTPNKRYKTEDSMAVDENLYSRQIGVFGLEMMTQLVKLRVLVVGLTGCGVEAAKNLILAGPSKVSVHDSTLCAVEDMGTNFYISKEDIGVKTRAQACLPHLADLNNYVTVEDLSAPLTAEMLTAFHVVLTSGLPATELRALGDQCHELGVSFISCDVFGLSCQIFCDFGDAHTVRDADGKEPSSAIIESVKDGFIFLYDNKRCPFEVGDYVQFEEVCGMTELNDLPPVEVQTVTKHSIRVAGVDLSTLSPYHRNGIVRQVKMPQTVRFAKYSDVMLEPLVQGEPCLPTPNLGKFGRSEQLHWAFQAVREFEERHQCRPRLWADAECAEVVEIARELNEKARDFQRSVSVENVDATVVAVVAALSRVEFAPLCAVVGGIAAQEAVKQTQKFMPLRQLLYVDCFELAPKTPPTPVTGSRFSHLSAIFDEEFRNKLASLKLFLVGAGALGCEFLKSFASLGIGSVGEVFLTDMDNIETSNLNRQFLFRRHHVGKEKSVVAAQEIVKMNPDINVSPHTIRVGADTEDFFNDAFWDSRDIVVNALDNVPSRLYVDGKCVWHGIPLLESGTLGTKGNIQVVLPRVTESYGSSQDPPEDSIPLCTLKNFPYEISHTIQWARDAFQGEFTDGPQELLTYLQDADGYIERLKGEGAVSVQKERVARILELVNLAGSRSLGQVVAKAHALFHSCFNHQVLQLLYNFPLDHVTEGGQHFWSGPKRPPQPLCFDVEDKLHMDFVYATAALLCYVLQISHPTREEVRDLAAALPPVPFMPRNVRIAINDDDAKNDGAVDDDVERDRLIGKIMSRLSELNLGLIIRAAEFEKDDDSNFHMSWIHSCANLRARNYKIAECTPHKSKMVAGKIVPAIATTTAMVTGFVVIELLKCVNYTERPIEDFANGFVNLSLPLWVQSEPIPPPTTKSVEYDPVSAGPLRARPEGFSIWDKVEIRRPDASLQDVFDYLTTEFNVAVCLVSAGNTLIYNSFMASHGARLGIPLSKLLGEVLKKPLPAGKNYITIEASCSDATDGVDVVLPPIKVVFKGDL
ncbi:MAG: hypothetical protein KVP17_004089 [Porospora cf. gigantea B]|uniref:uncharacterized protein n=2 Tax=Porospora cf. gigantea B TaxID=2853592 RepID=UPI0035719783|nr:MAG: hypothetical protein KVP17_004089 [Porospora cf. gigantea B]